MGCLLNKYQEIFYGVNKERIKQSNLKGYTFFKKFVVNLKEKKKNMGDYKVLHTKDTRHISI